MNEDQIKGKMKEIKGDVKQRIGGASKDPKTQGEGWLEEKEGQLRKGVGDVEKDVSERQQRREPPPEEKK